MGRRRTQLKLSKAQIRNLRQLLQNSSDDRLRERLRFALLAATGRDTLEDLARHLGRSRSTIQNWLVKFTVGGIAELLNRDTPPGMASPLANRNLQTLIETGLRAGQWRSAAEIAAWLHQEHGLKRSRKSIYYWIAKFEADAPGGVKSKKNGARQP
jgi:transposase